MYALLALVNGLIIGTSRAVNGRLSKDKSPFYASMWNHAVGWAFLCVPVFAFAKANLMNAAESPAYSYLGGVFGALYVAVQSSVFSRLGATNTTIAVINGQMLSALLADALFSNGVTLPQIGGVALILLGVILSRFRRA